MCCKKASFDWKDGEKEARLLQQVQSLDSQGLGDCNVFRLIDLCHHQSKSPEGLKAVLLKPLQAEIHGGQYETLRERDGVGLLQRPGRPRLHLLLAPKMTMNSDQYMVTLDEKLLPFMQVHSATHFLWNGGRSSRTRSRRCGVQLPNDLVMKLAQSMPRRLWMCIDNKGQMTKY